MALSTSSSSSSASSSREWKNDLFLSFSGEDIRKNLLSHLYKELDRKPILVFKDNEIKKGQSLGPKLKREIRDSRIAVVIFSKKYASSSWCLNELLEIMKCKKVFNQVVIPIFFRLDPTHVRKQTGVFGTNFEKTCCNKTEKLKIRWRRALTDGENAFKEMRNLPYLNISLHLSEDLEFPPRLRSMPSNFRPQNLVNLEMKNSRFEKLWDGIQPLGTLKKMDLWGSKNLKEIPDLSMATNLDKLYLGACSSLVELPSSVRYLNKLKELDMSFCINLETLPTNINLQSLDRLNLFGCSRLRSFPKISTNISYLNLSQTGIEEVPWWIENFTKVRKLSMWGCEKLWYVSLNISKLKHLETVDFSLCGELKVASLNESPIAVPMAEDIRSKFPDNVKVSSSLADDSFPRVKLNFINCFNLDQEALLQQQLVFKRMILPGEEVPSYFTHLADPEQDLVGGRKI